MTHFHRRLGTYLATNHPKGGSGKLTPRQRRRLWKKNPAEMIQRRAEYVGDQTKRGWA